MIGTHNSTLESALDHFRRRFNDSDRVKKLVKGWRREIWLEVTDSTAEFTMLIDDLEVIGVRHGAATLEPVVRVRGSDEVLQRVFNGEYNPAHALIDGAIEVYSHERDKVKLEAIAMVIWGM